MAVSLSSTCVPSTFSGLSFFGGEVLSIDAALVTNYSAVVLGDFRGTSPTVVLEDATFCNVTVSYTHPGQDDNIFVETWLPVENPTWNSRLYAVGGGGWAAGRYAASYEIMKGALGDGYATTTTDAGLGSATGPEPWALTSPGNVNWVNLHNFASVSLNDNAIISKALTTSFYTQPPAFSYFNGCSQGGRQAMQLAQRYPTAYDGIAAGAPGLYTSRTFPAMFWSQQVMNVLGRYPYGCEVDALTAAAVEACDGLDGVVDGIVADPDACLGVFDPFPLIGTAVEECVQAGNGTVEISTAAAVVVNATWHGIVTATGEKTWYGFSPGTNLVDAGGIPGVAATDCSGGECVGVPGGLGPPWFEQFLAKGHPDFEVGTLSYEEFDDLVHYGRQVYRAAIDTDDPDLSRFRDAGGKMVSWHGLWDTLVPPKATEHYYDEVTALLPEVHDFYHHYEVPGLGHCMGGKSGQPSGLFEQLRAWVENGTAPDHTPVNVTVLDGTMQRRILCPYPQTARFDEEGCENSDDASCWSCADASGGEN